MDEAQDQRQKLEEENEFKNFVVIRMKRGRKDKREKKEPSAPGGGCLGDLGTVIDDDPDKAEQPIADNRTKPNQTEPNRTKPKLECEVNEDGTNLSCHCR